MEENEPPHISRCLPPTPPDDEAAAASDTVMPDAAPDPTRTHPSSSSSANVLGFSSAAADISLLNSDLYLMGVDMGFGTNDLLYIFGGQPTQTRTRKQNIWVFQYTLCVLHKKPRWQLPVR